MYISKKEIENIVNDFCKKNNYSPKMFDVSAIARTATGGEKERLTNTTSVTNRECTYVIKYYEKLDIIVIWNYSKSPSMSYSYRTIKEKLSVGIRYADKGRGFHQKEQSLVFFDKGKNLYQLLQLVTNPI